MLKGKKQKLFLITIKLLIFAVTIIYIYKTLVDAEGERGDAIDGLLLSLQNLDFFSYLLISITVLLTFANWGLETRKWQVLMEQIFPISYSIAFKAVLSGVTISTWMPNRIGEYIGRILYLPGPSRIKAIFATITGSLAQMLATYLFGALGLTWYLVNFFEGETWFIILLLILLYIGAAIFIYIFYHLYRVQELLPKKQRLEKLRQSLRILSKYSRSDLNHVLLLAMVRYAVFTTQYVLLLIAFDAEVGILTSLALITSIFFVQSIIPSMAITELGTRGALAFLFFGAVTKNFTSVLSASYGVWLINLIIPSIIGAVFIVLSEPAQKRLRRK